MGTEEDGDERTSQTDEMKYSVDLIVEHRDEQDGTRTYRVRWFGYDPPHDIFEPE